jgi:hypothetical protein
MTRRQAAEPEGEGLETGLGFGSPPPGKRPLKYDWPAIAAKCKRRPGKWLLVFEQDKATYYSAIGQGNITALRPSSGFEIRSANTRRNATPRVLDLWVRYVPEKDTTTKEGTK